MENCLLNYFIFNDELRSSCDFNSFLLTEGPGIYEVIRVTDAKPLFLHEHLQRFFQSSVHEGFDIGITGSDLKNRIKILIEQNKLKTGNIRFQHIVHPESGNLFLAWIMANHYPSPQEVAEGVKMTTLNVIREKPHSKRTNLPARILSEKIISKQDVEEVLLVSKEGLITEGSRSNIFFVKENKLFTPHPSLVLPGITREKIMGLARENSIRLVENFIRLNELTHFEACFLCSTSRDVLPVRQLDSIHFEVNDAITRKISLLYENLVRQHLAKFTWTIGELP